MKGTRTNFFNCIFLLRVTDFSLTPAAPNFTRPISKTKYADAHSDHSSGTVVMFPTTGWKTLQNGQSQCPEFTVSTIMSLFLHTCCSDGKGECEFQECSWNIAGTAALSHWLYIKDQSHKGREHCFLLSPVPA